MDRLVTIIFRYLYNKQYFLWVTIRTYIWSKLFKKFGKNSFIFGRVIIFYPENITLGNNSALDEGVLLHAKAPIDIGDDVHMSPGVVLTTGSREINEPFPQRKRVAKPINVGSGTWIATQSIILPGVSIGKNSIVSANSLVNKDIPDNAVVAGSPARIVGFLPYVYGKKGEDRPNK